VAVAGEGSGHFHGRRTSLYSFYAILKMDKTSLLRCEWPEFNAIWQADADYNGVIVFVVFVLVVVGGGALPLPISQWVTSLSSKGQKLSSSQISTIISIHGWDITTSGLQKLTSAILEFYFRFSFLLYHRNRHVTLYQFVTLHQNQVTRSWVITSCRFSRWQPRRRNTTSGFELADIALLRRPKSVGKPNFVRIIQSTAELQRLPV